MNKINFSEMQLDKLGKNINFQKNKNKVVNNTTQLPQDSVELNQIQQSEAKKAKKENTKKTVKAIALTATTLVALAYLGNKLSSPTAKLGVEIDEKLTKNSFYKRTTGFFGNIKNSIKGFFMKSKTVQNISDTFKTKKATAKCQMARGYEKGPVGIFSLTPVDTLKKGFAGKDSATIEKSLSNIMNSKDAKTFANMISSGNTGADNQKFCSDFSNTIRNKFGCKNNKEFLEVLENLKNGNYGKEFTDIVMIDKWKKPNNILEAVMSLYEKAVCDWWPVRAIDKIKLKIAPNSKPFGRGNLGDSLIKFNAINGSLATTGAGKFTQKMLTLPTESISNFVNDKSGLGFFISFLPPIANLPNLYKDIQDAPSKKQKVGTVANNFLSSTLSWAIVTPLAYKATYGLATLGRIDPNKGALAKPIKAIGSFFNMGLENKASLVPKSTLSKLGGTVGKGLGGALRFALIMFVFSGILRKPIEKLVNKITGKPFNKAEEDQKKAIEAQKNAIVPELGITQGEFIEKMQKNPEAMQKIQSDPFLAKRVMAEPKLILDILDGKEVSGKQKDKIYSPANEDLLKRRGIAPNVAQRTSLNMTPQQNNFTTETVKPKQQSAKTLDKLSYIPSSDFCVQSAGMSQEQQAEYDVAMAKADAAIKTTTRYINS